MFTIASFEEVRQLVNAIYSMKTIEDSENVFDMFTSNLNFQNDYNIMQVRHIFRNAIEVNPTRYSILKNTLLRFMEKYPLMITDVDGEIFIPYSCSFEVYFPDDEQVSFINGMTLKKDSLPVDTIIEVNNDERTILTLTVLENNGSDSRVSFNSYGSVTIQGRIRLSLTIGDYDSIDFLKSHQNDEFGIMKAIEEDDIDTLQNIFAVYPEKMTSNICKPKSSCHDIYSGITPIEYAILMGAINCFKYLFLNDCYQDSQTSNSYWGVIYAVEKCLVYGGNLEILRILISNHSHLDARMMIISSIHKHDFDMFMYWYSRHDIDYDDKLFRAVFESNNCDVLEFLHNNNITCTSKYLFTTYYGYNIEMYTHYGYTERALLGDMNYKLRIYVYVNNIPHEKMESDYECISHTLIRNLDFDQVKKILDTYPQLFPNSEDKKNDFVKRMIQAFFYQIRSYPIITDDDFIKYVEYFDLRGTQLSQPFLPHSEENIIQTYALRSATNIEPNIITLFKSRVPEVRISRKRFMRRNKRNLDSQKYKEIYNLLETLDMFK